MSLTAFDRELGTAQGRIVPARVQPAEGAFVFVLGSEAPGRVMTLGSGDLVELAQTSSCPGVRYVRARIRLRKATSVPDESGWRFSWSLDDVPFVERIVDRDQELVDVAANVSPIDPGSFELAFALQLLGPVDERWEAELPGVYVDALTLVSSDERPVFANRFPEPGHVQVRVNSTVSVDVMDHEDVVDPTRAQVWVDGVLAWNGSSFQTGFTGPDSSTALRDSDHTLRIVVDPTALFTSLQVVTVRVRYETADAFVRDESYAFTVEDLTAPVLERAQARDRQTVRVTFSEPLAEGALDPTKWTIEPVQGALLGWGDFQYGAAIAVAVVGIEQITPLVFDVRADVSMTMRATYRIAIAGVEDTFGNPISQLTAVQQFVSVDDRVPARNLRLVDRVPRMNVREDATQDLRKFLWAWQEPIELMLAIIDEWLAILDPRTAPEESLDAMLADLGNPFQFPLSVAEKRKLIFLLVPIYRQKGSAEGIVSTVRLFLGIEVTITYPGQGGLGLGFMMLGGTGEIGTFGLGGDAYDQYGYQVNVAQLLTEDEREKIRGISLYMQAANEHLIQIAEPTALPPSPDHLVLGFSQLDVNWILH